MRGIGRALALASLQGCFWVGGDSEEDRLRDLDQDGIADVDDCRPAEPGGDNGQTYFQDLDGDGAGNPDETTVACAPPDGYVTDQGDCDDGDGGIHPGADDGCNGLDDDCDDKIDESPDTEWFLDGDGDGFGGGDPFFACARPGDGYTTASGDCDDGDSKSYPDAPVVCAAEDRDCDGIADDADADGDGYAGCLECDDTDKGVFPGADESCNGTDDDCDGTVDEDADDATIWYLDADGDGEGDQTDTGTPSCATALPGHSKAAVDCDDSDAAISTKGVEVCDGIDQTCDGSEDDATDAETFYADVDLDGYGDATAGTKSGCNVPTGYSRYDSDCDDANANVNPAAVENNCADPTDYNCDGVAGQVDNDNDTYFACAECDDTDPAVHPDAQEFCNLVDDDCNGQVDDGAPSDATPWYADVDKDGYGNPGASTLACVRPTGTVADATDCDDAQASIHPGAIETCTTPGDDDCDGTINESDAFDSKTFYADADGDGFGDPGKSQPACAAPAGYVANDTDCDDQSAPSHPGGTEACDPGNADEDCDGTADDLDPSVTGKTPWYADADKDGYGDKATTKSACDAPPNYVANTQDCNDGDPTYFPGAPETCTDKFDFNCDGAIGAKDADGDTFSACTECDDGDAKVYPGAAEVVGDGIDQDCDGVDRCYKDVDLDGFGSTSEANSTSLSCGPGLSVNKSDCDDADAGDRPGATELVGNEDDEDCDGAEVCYTDADDDNFGLSTTSKSTNTLCGALLAKVTGDCDDADGADYPGAIELVANGDDENCDGREVCYADLDGDKFGTSTTLQSTDADCDDAGESKQFTDCDDKDSGDYPGALELVANTDDEDCDAKELCYVDADGDKAGNPNATTKSSVLTCVGTGISARATDCNDANATIYAGAKETVADTIDQNCDGGDTCWLDGDYDLLQHPNKTVGSADLDCVDAGESKGSAPDCNDTVANGDFDKDGTKDCAPDPDCPRWVNGAANLVASPCGGFSNPCKTLKTAIQDRGTCTAIFVKDGAYTDNIDTKGVDLVIASVEGAAATSIDGGLTGPVFTYENGETSASLVQGFTIKGGRGKSPRIGSDLFAQFSNVRFGGGIYVDEASPTLAANVIRGNDLTAGPVIGQPGCGGGLFLYASDSFVFANVITQNKAVTGGGGVCALATTATFFADQVNDNTSTAVPADGVLLAGDASTWLRNVIFANGNGANVVLDTTAATLVHNLIFNDTTNIAVTGDDTSLIANNTIHGGTNGVSFSAGTDGSEMPRTSAVNNQVTASSGCGVLGNYAGVTFTTNNVYTATGTALCNGPITGTGNTQLPVTYDTSWRLYAGSGGLGVGTNLYAVLGNADDLDGTDVRPHTGAWTVGAQQETAP